MKVFAGMGALAFTMFWGGVAASGASAQDTPGGSPPVGALPVDQGVATPDDAPSPTSVTEPGSTTTPPAPVSPTTPPSRPRGAVTQLADAERPLEPTVEVTEPAIGRGSRLVLQLQST